MSEAKKSPPAGTTPESLGLFFLFLLLTCFLLGSDFHQRSMQVEAATRLETSEAPRSSLPVSTEARRRWTVLPATALDARCWVIHAESALTKGRVHHTDFDNAPVGREVHWSSVPNWLLGGIARILAWFAGTSPLEQIQNAPLWYGPAVFAMLAAMVSVIVGPRWGWGFAGFLVFYLAAAFPLYDNFRPGDAGHRGLVLVFLLGSALCLAGGGMGWVVSGATGRNTKQELLFPPLISARVHFAWTGLLGSMALWISAATTIPLLAACSLGALAAAIWKPGGRTALHPELWRIWGLWGCLGSLAFYLIEYFPGHLGWRLEVNHPLYALAWLSGSDILSRALTKLSGGRFVRRSFRDAILLAVGCMCLALPPLLIFLHPEHFFWPADRFLLTVSREHVRECASLWTYVLTRVGWSGAFEHLAWPVFAVGSLFCFLFRAKPWQSWHPFLAFSYVVAGAIQILALFQIRWTALALCLWAVCVLFILVIWIRRQYTGRLPWLPRLALAAWALASLLTYPALVVQAAVAPDDSSNLPRNLVPSILLRDIAHRLVESNPHRLPVVLSDPTSATELAYYGGIRTIGTLYWENMPGLKHAARIFSAPTEKDFGDLLHAAGVTHIVLPSWDDFSDLSAYTRLCGTSHPPYFQQVLDGSAHPAWIREFPYPIPGSFGIPNEWIRVFEIRWPAGLEERSPSM